MMSAQFPTAPARLSDFPATALDEAATKKDEEEKILFSWGSGIIRAKILKFFYFNVFFILEFFDRKFYFRIF